MTDLNVSHKIYLVPNNQDNNHLLLITLKPISASFKNLFNNSNQIRDIPSPLCGGKIILSYINLISDRLNLLVILDFYSAISKVFLREKE